MNKDLILSGVQPTGNLHLGNYLGAIRNWVMLQEKSTCFFTVVDLHAITVWQDPKILQQQTREVTAAFLAAGINPDLHPIFNQSQVEAHARLGWILSCVARVGWLNRMIQFKEKAGKDKENVSVGLFSYPTLMAADILLYKATHVPVGEDQKQHIELTRDIAQKFNNDFGVAYFQLPEPKIMGTATRLMSLRDGTKKMSKSDPSDYSRLNILDDDDLIRDKIRKAKTDLYPLPGPEVLGSSGEIDPQITVDRPEAINLLNMYTAVARQSIAKTLQEFAGKEFSFFKKELVEVLITHLGPIGNKMKKLMQDPSYIDEVLKKGVMKARAVANKTLHEVHQIMGFLETGYP